MTIKHLGTVTLSKYYIGTTNQSESNICQISESAETSYIQRRSSEKPNEVRRRTRGIHRFELARGIRRQSDLPFFPTSSAAPGWVFDGIRLPEQLYARFSRNAFARPRTRCFLCYRLSLGSCPLIRGMRKIFRFYLLLPERECFLILAIDSSGAGKKMWELACKRLGEFACRMKRCWGNS